MQCLRKYEWVKLLRSYLPHGKGIMAYWAKLASHAAFRKGQALYLGYINEVLPGMWSGGMMGLKSILNINNRQTVLNIMDQLSSLGYVIYDIDEKTKKLVYQITGWVVKCTEAASTGKSVYAVDDYGFLSKQTKDSESLKKR